MDGIFGACFHTDTAADTFRMIWCLQDIDIHLAYFYTLLTSDTLVFFYLNAEKRYLIKQGIDCAKRADPFTEGSVKKNAQNNHGDQYHAFERKQSAECCTNGRITKCQRNGTFQNTLWTNIFAEERIPHSDRVRYKHRQKYNKNNKNDIFQVS